MRTISYTNTVGSASSGPTPADCAARRRHAESGASGRNGAAAHREAGRGKSPPAAIWGAGNRPGITLPPIRWPPCGNWASISRRGARSPPNRLPRNRRSHAIRRLVRETHRSFGIARGCAERRWRFRGPAHPRTDRLAVGLEITSRSVSRLLPRLMAAASLRNEPGAVVARRNGSLAVAVCQGTAECRGASRSGWRANAHLSSHGAGSAAGNPG